MIWKSRYSPSDEELSVTDSKLVDQQLRKLWNQPMKTHVVCGIVHCLPTAEALESGMAPSNECST